MKNKIMSVVLAVVTLLVMQRCTSLEQREAVAPVAQPDVSVDVVEENGRLSFKSKKAFNEMITKLNVMTQAEQKAWLSEFKFSSLFHEYDTVTVDSMNYNRFPTSYKILLNKKGEVAMGDTLVWYTSYGKVHYVPNHNEKELSDIRAGRTVSKIEKTYSAKPYRNKNQAATGNRIDINYLDARYQKEWNWRGDGNWRRKFVDELYVWWDGDHYLSQIYVRIKDERWAEVSLWYHDWAPTQDHRIIIYNLSWSVTLRGGYRPTPNTGPTEFVNSQYQYLDIYSDYQVFLAQDYYIYLQEQDVWSAEVSGSIYQWLPNDFPDNQWQIQYYPLW